MKFRNVLLTLALLTGCMYGQVVTIGTYAGAQPTANCNPPVTYVGVDGSGTASLIYSGFTPITGTNYITYTTGAGGSGKTTYTTTCTGNLAGYTGTASLIADDSATLSINGKLIVSASPYNTLNTAAIPAGVFVDGSNTITSVVTNLSWVTGVDFLITATPPVTPPPPPPPSNVYNYTFVKSHLVTMTTATPGATICYSSVAQPVISTNGKGACNSGAKYLGAFTITASRTFYVVAGKAGYTDSPVVTAIFTAVSAPTK